MQVLYIYTVYTMVMSSLTLFRSPERGQDSLNSILTSRVTATLTLSTTLT